MVAMVAAAAVSALVSAGVGLVARAIASKSASQPSSNVTAWTPTNVDLLSQQPDPGGAHIGVFGHRRLGGKVVFSGKTGGKTYLVIEIAGAPIAAINGFFINNAAATIDGSGNVTNAPWSSSLNVALYDGTQTVVDSVMAAAFPNWTADYVGKQIAYARIRIDPTAVASSVYQGGVPDFTFDVSGFKCYDPRDGTQDISTRSTWKFSANAAILNANYLVHPLGHNLPTDRVDWDSVTAAANVCDEAVTLKGGGSEARYTAAPTWQTNERHETVLDRIGQAHAGGAYFIGKKYRVRSGSWAASSATYTPDNYAGEGLSFSETPPLAQICNGVRGTFTSPLHNYESRDFPAFQDATALTTDGQEFWQDLQLEAVTSPTQAQRLAKIAYMKARYGFPASVELQFSAFETTAEDVISITDDLAGFSAKTFRVNEDQLTGDYVCRLTLVHEAESFFAWTPASDEQDFVTVASVTGEGGGVGSPGMIVYDNGGGSGINPCVVYAEFTPPGSGNATNIRFVWNGGGAIALSAVQQNYGSIENSTASIGLRLYSVWATDANGISSPVANAQQTLDVINDHTAATAVAGPVAGNTSIILPAPAAPRLLTAFNGSAKLFVPAIGGTRSRKMRLYENSTNNSGTATLVDTQNNTGATFTRSAAVGVVKWYWARTYDEVNGVESGFSNPTLVVF